VITIKYDCDINLIGGEVIKATTGMKYRHGAELILVKENEDGTTESGVQLIASDTGWTLGHITHDELNKLLEACGESTI